MYTYTYISWCVYTNLCGRTSSDSICVCVCDPLCTETYRSY